MGQLLRVPGLLTRLRPGQAGGAHPHSTEVAPGLGAPAHQHLFSARLDMDVDGQANAVEEVDVAGLPAGPGNPHGNALVQQVTRLRTESQAARRADGARGRTWRVLSTERANRFGHPVSYTLMARCGFTLKPTGFFDRNPTLDVPPPHHC